MSFNHLTFESTPDSSYAMLTQPRRKSWIFDHGEPTITVLQFRTPSNSQGYLTIEEMEFARATNPYGSFRPPWRIDSQLYFMKSATTKGRIADSPRETIRVFSARSVFSRCHHKTWQQHLTGSFSNVIWRVGQKLRDSQHDTIG